MEQVLNRLLENSTLPLATAFLLGLLIAISPCSLAKNITAIGYIGREIENRNVVFINGLIYTVGKAVSYTVIALVIYIGADQFKISGLFQQYGEKVLGPLLIVVGLFMLDILKIKLPGLSFISNRLQEFGTKSYWDVLLLGMLFALTFCPYDGILYFGMLVPLSISSAKGLYLPVVFAIATSIPVIIFAWFIAYTVSGIGRLYNRLKEFELWFRKIIAVLFTGVGIYYIIIIYF
jgi:cytochrome c-type biogenesis protein